MRQTREERKRVIRRRSWTSLIPINLELQFKPSLAARVIIPLLQYYVVYNSTLIGFVLVLAAQNVYGPGS